MARCAVVLCIAILLAGCSSLVQRTTQQAQPLESVGHIQFGELTWQDGEPTIPLTYTGGKLWVQNSAVVPYRVRSRADESQIEITLITALATGTSDPDRDGYEIRLPTGTKGRHLVVYVDPDGQRHEIGAVELPK